MLFLSSENQEKNTELAMVLLVLLQMFIRFVVLAVWGMSAKHHIN